MLCNNDRFCRCSEIEYVIVFIAHSGCVLSVDTAPFLFITKLISLSLSGLFSYFFGLMSYEGKTNKRMIHRYFSDNAVDILRKKQFFEQQFRKEIGIA